MHQLAPQKQDQLSILKAFHRLEVGPLKLERKRLIAPYRLFFDGKADAFELDIEGYDLNARKADPGIDRQPYVWG